MPETRATELLYAHMAVMRQMRSRSDHLNAFRQATAAVKWIPAVFHDEGGDDPGLVEACWEVLSELVRWYLVGLGDQELRALLHVTKSHPALESKRNQARFRASWRSEQIKSFTIGYEQSKGIFRE